VEAAPQTEAEPKRTEATTVAKQLEIDWTRARQLMVLASAEIADAVIVEGDTPRKVRAVVLKAVLQAIDHHGRGKAAWVSYETIAREARICLRQAKRAIIALEQESLLVTDTRKCNHYSIVWSELNLRCPSQIRSRNLVRQIRQPPNEVPCVRNEVPWRRDEVPWGRNEVP